MAPGSERRRVARLPVPSQRNSPGPEQEVVRFLDLSSQGARTEHTRPLPARGLVFLDLPPALGGSYLQGEPIWTQVVGRQQRADGTWAVIHHSGLRFTMLTPGQQECLRAALDILKAVQQG